MFKSDDCYDIKPRGENCCHYRKVMAMQQALSTLKPGAIVSARGRFQAVTRRKLELVEWETNPIRVNPLVHWTQDQLEQYIKDNSIPYNVLYDQGYPSVGCWPCTGPVEPGQDIRAGRWDGLGKVECGLWE
jgi:phosphoadenosine phosphosulfate reductase